MYHRGVIVLAIATAFNRRNVSRRLAFSRDHRIFVTTERSVVQTKKKKTKNKKKETLVIIYDAKPISHSIRNFPHSRRRREYTARTHIHAHNYIT